MTQHKDLELFAKNIRIQVLKALGELGFGHLGGAMSAADVLGVLYGGVMNVDPKNPQWEDRDYFVMSKGHAGPALYAALALKGYFPVEQLLTINTNGTRLPSHPDRNSTTGVDMSTGSASPMEIKCWERTTIPTCCWATARARRDRCGREPCTPRSTSCPT